MGKLRGGSDRDRKSVVGIETRRVFDILKILGDEGARSRSRESVEF
jgi:hypothetical protein